MKIEMDTTPKWVSNIFYIMDKLLKKGYKIEFDTKTSKKLGGTQQERDNLAKSINEYAGE